MSKPYPVWLYSQALPLGQLFTLTHPEVEAKLAEGWFDSPAKLIEGEAAAAPQSSTPAAPVVKIDADALRAMFLTGKDLTGPQIKELAAALGVKFKPVGESTAAIAEKIKAELQGTVSQSSEPPSGAADDPDDSNVPPLTPAQ